MTLIIASAAMGNKIASGSYDRPFACGMLKQAMHQDV